MLYSLIYYIVLKVDIH